MNLRAVEARVLALAPWLMAASMAGHLLMVALQAKMTMIDLRVYRGGAPQLFTDHLYDWRLSEFSDQFALPFTYPPFAALVFVPLSWVSWAVARWFWQLLSLACLWWLVRAATRLAAARLGPAGGSAGRGLPDRESTVDEQVWRRRAMLWTALAIWTEPVRTTLNYGQINLLLAAILLASMASARPWVSGLGIGLTAGVKLTPAVSGLYLLARRRFAAAAWSVGVFLATVGLGYLVNPGQANTFWFEVGTDASRVGPVGSAINQSLRGALSRTLGHDVGTGPVWLVAVAAAAVLLGFALRAALRAGDQLAAILSVQVFGLLVSPISWSHHWVWMLPALVWLLYGGAGAPVLRAVTAVLWLAAVGSFLISLLLIMQESIWVIPRPWYESALGWVYPACGLLTLVTVALARRGPVGAGVLSPAGAPAGSAANQASPAGG
ncbi:mannosyltransferase [Goodfellowiella coeruleoviolacea]|uniref:Alpha-1,2-mannosyltransferase n=1 Tax=Goodfellowiella coeruleoviolacea TaxID=334858 RepID=A0AAE3KGP5_9PSEU|nr:mannosyltransferase [Goodfellowiella coeruleoviolacea]MCP2165649.1 alpha-1,2-mannosyltransferase [Goodfellowiella coeruleoviolacea]